MIQGVLSMTQGEFTERHLFACLLHGFKHQTPTHSSYTNDGALSPEDITST